MAPQMANLGSKMSMSEILGGSWSVFLGESQGGLGRSWVALGCLGTPLGPSGRQSTHKSPQGRIQRRKLIPFVFPFGIYFYVFVQNLFLTLFFFLIVASYHFGREDTSFLHDGNSYIDQLFYLIKGSLIIFAPLFFHFDETLKVFEILFMNKTIIIFIKNEHWIINIFMGLGVLGYFYFIYKNKFKDFEILFLDMFSILILNYVFSTLFAFTIYFCFLHSIRHIISLSYELDPNNFVNGIKIFVKKALPLTIVTAFLYLLTIFFLSNSYGLNDVIIKVIFIGLASLTFPHILLEYLIEVNEKRT